MKETSAVTANLATVFGLRAGHPVDEKLARAIANPASKWTERFVYSRGLCTVTVSGMYLESLSHAGVARHWIKDIADRLPEYPHLSKIKL